MQKRIIFLIVLLVVVAAFAIMFAVVPETAWAITNTVKDGIIGFTVGVTSMVASSPIWINYGHYIAFGIGALFIGLMFWQGHNIYNTIRQQAARSAAKEAYGWQTAPPVSTPQPITQQPQAPPTPVQTQPVEQPPQTEQPKQ